MAYRKQEVDANVPEGVEEEAAYQAYLDAEYDRYVADGMAAEGKDYIKEEEHPAFDDAKGLMNRFLYKNFKGSPEEGLKKMAEDYPDMEMKLDEESGDVIARGEGESAWKKLDSNKQSFADITDILADAGAAGVETMGSAMGGLGGAAAGLFAGPAAPVAVPALGLGGAAVGGAAGAASSEWLRQKIGEMTGYSEGIKGDEIGDIAKWGALSPAIMGSGLTKKALEKFTSSGIGDKLLKKSIEPLAAKTGGEFAIDTGMEALMQGQKGLIGHGMGAAKGAVKGLGAGGSGVEQDISNWAYDNLGKIKMAEQSPQGSAYHIGEVYSTLSERVNTKRREVGTGIGRVLRENGQEQISVLGAQNPFDELLQKYQGIHDKGPTQSSLDDLNFIKKERDDLFKDIKNSMPERDDIYLVPEGGLEQATQYIGDLDPETALHLKGKIDALSGVRKTQKAGTDVSLKNLGPVEKEMRVAATKASMSINNTIEMAIPAEYEELKRSYSTLIKSGDTVNDLFGTEKKTAATMNTFFNNGKSETRARVLNTAELLGVDVLDKIKQHAAIGIYANPDPLVGGFAKPYGGKIPAAIAGGGLGYMAGSAMFGGEGGEGGEGGMGGHAGSIGTAMLGGYLGGSAFSRKAMRKYMGGHKTAAKKWDVLQNGPIVPTDYAPAAPQTLMNMEKNINKGESNGNAQ